MVASPGISFKKYLPVLKVDPDILLEKIVVSGLLLEFHLNHISMVKLPVPNSKSDDPAKDSCTTLVESKRPE